MGPALHQGYIHVLTVSAVQAVSQPMSEMSLQVGGPRCSKFSQLHLSATCNMSFPLCKDCPASTPAVC